MHNTTQKGRNAESIACKFLEDNGFEILNTNFYTTFGEIDIIAQKNKILHFIEVKSGIGFEPIHNINKSKLEKLIKSIFIYMSTLNKRPKYCLSVLILRKDKNEQEYKIEWLENITIYH